MVVVQPTPVSALVRTEVTVNPGETSFDVGLPTGIAAGHVILLAVERLQPGTTNMAAVPGFFMDIAQASIGPSFRDLQLWRRFATGSEGTTKTLTVASSASAQSFAVSAIAYKDAANAAVVLGNTGTGSPTAWTSPTYPAVVASKVVSIFALGTNPTLTKDAGSTLRSPGLDVFSGPLVLDKPDGPGTTSGTTLTSSSGSMAILAVTVGLRPVNSAPYAPTLNFPAAGEVIDVAIDNAFTFTFGDPDFDLPRLEGQLKYEIRYKVAGGPTWTTLTPAPTANEFHVFAGGTFTTGVNYVWQVRCFDLAGEPGDWSPDGFVTGGTAPTAAVLVTPTLDQNVNPSEPMTWTVITQSAYRYRRVADNGSGSPDTTQIYFTSDPIAVSAERGPVLVAFPVNKRVEHLQHQVWDGTLWSQWTSRRVNVNWVRPPIPDVALTPIVAPAYPDLPLARIRVDITNPPSVGAQPETTENEVWVDDGDGKGLIRKAIVAPNGSWTYPAPRSKVDYDPLILVVAIGANGAIAGRRVITFILGSPTRGLLGTNLLG